MKKWILKAVVQKIISFLPYSNSINYFFQKHVTKGVYLTDEYFYDRLKHASNHLKAYHKFSEQKTPKTTLEIGTGWYPVVPVALYLCGAEKIYSVDVSLLTSKKRLLITLEKFVESYENNQLSKYIDFKNERFEIIKEIIKNSGDYNLEKMLQKLHICYLVEDARQLSLQNDSVDLISSNNTFEHIYPIFLEGILLEFKRIISKENGIMSHFIDMTDHFAHFDKSITEYNFLKFSEREWQWIDNSIQPQSRLRFDDYKSIYTNINIPINDENFEMGSIEKLSKIKLDKKFSSKTEDINAITHCYFISVMK